jgi:hypothetical protein
MLLILKFSKSSLLLILLKHFKKYLLANLAIFLSISGLKILSTPKERYIAKCFKEKKFPIFHLREFILSKTKGVVNKQLL